LPRYVHGGPWQPANDPNFNPDNGPSGKGLRVLFQLGRAIGVIIGVLTVDESRVGETEWEGEDGYSYKYTSADFGLRIYKDGRQIVKYEVLDSHDGFLPRSKTPIVGVIDENGKVTPVSRQDDIAYRAYLANGGKESFTEWVSAGRPGDDSEVPLERQSWRKPKITPDGKVIPYGKTAADAKRIQMPKGAKPGQPFTRNGFSINYDENGFPVFQSRFDTYIDDNLIGNGSDLSHFQSANRNLGKALRENPRLAKEIGLTQKQIDFFLKQPPLKQRPPGNLTWHHHQDVGKMQLVPTDIHRAFLPHTGGMSIWGGGY